MSETWTLGLKLFIITAVAGFILGFTNYLTEQPIMKQRIQADMEARLAVLPSAKEFEEIEIDEVADENSKIIEIYRAVDADNNIVGYTFKVLTSGFGGDVEVIVGINSDGIIEGIRIGEHSETPGLGAKASEEGFTEQFAGKAIDMQIEVNKTGDLADNKIQAITGATITSECVSNAVNLAINYYSESLIGGIDN